MLFRSVEQNSCGQIALLQLTAYGSQPVTLDLRNFRGGRFAIFRKMGRANNRHVGFLKELIDQAIGANEPLLGFQMSFRNTPV